MLWAAGRQLGSPDLDRSGPARDLRLAPDRCGRPHQQLGRSRGAAKF